MDNNYYEKSFSEQSPVYNQQFGNAPVNTNLEEPVSMKEWLITFLILMVPCVNIVMMFVWAFSSTEKKSKSNFFKVQLILTGIGLALYILFLIVIFGVAMFAELANV